MTGGPERPASRPARARAARWTAAALASLLAAAAAGARPAEGDAADLPGPWAAWLAEVSILLSDEERAVFLSLDRDARRAEFVEHFWRVRDPFPETGRNEFRELWNERLRVVRESFGGLEGERGRVALVAGPPNRIELSPCPQRLRSLELWIYHAQKGRAAFNLVLLPGPGGWRLWSPSLGLRDLVTWGRGGPLGELELRRELRSACPRGDELVQQLEQAIEPRTLDRQASWLPRPPGEWLQVFLARSTDLPDDAALFDAELVVSFPGRHQNRTVVQGLLAVPRAQAEPLAAGERRLYRFEVDGEIQREGMVFDRFRYRFELPVDEVGSERIPLVLQRFLRPGSYRAALRARDLASGRYFRVERDLDVPRVDPAAVALPAASAPAGIAAPAPAGEPPPAAAGLPAELLAEANAELPLDIDELRLLPPPEGLLTGRVRFEAAASGERITKVTFRLDGRAVMSKSRPPFSVELDLGRAPRILRLEAVGYAEDGREVARDEIPLNTGPHRFAVRLVEPRPGGRYRSSLRAHAEVDVPRGAELERVELYLNEDLLATLYQPPFVQPMLLPTGQRITYVRAKAILEDGNATEDLVFINAPEHLDQLQVDFVELYTSVVDRKGRPADDLAAADFQVLEEGEPQRIRRFERVRDLPIWAGVVLDTSTSMAEEVAQAERAALKFFERVVQPKDRAAVIVFNDRPELRVPFTNNLEVLAGGLAELEVEGETALYDTLVYGLHYFAGIRGKRALILLSDGEDSSSRHSFSEALDFARRTGTAIYAIGLSLGTRDFETRSVLMRLAHETGGECFFIDRASQLDTIYERIEEELRTQYLLGYQSSHSGDEFREVEVKVARAGLKAKTIPGYYP